MNLKFTQKDSTADELLPFDSIDMNDNVLVNDNNIKRSPIAVNAESNEPSKISKLSISIKSKISATKKREVGFEQIGDDELDDSDKEDPAANYMFDIPIRRKKCTTTIICIAVIILFISLAILIAVIINPHANSASSNCMKGRKVLIISLDGFRAEYLHRIPTPNIDKYLINQGVTVKSMKPVYPSKV